MEQDPKKPFDAQGQDTDKIHIGEREFDVPKRIVIPLPIVPIGRAIRRGALAVDAFARTIVARLRGRQ